MVSNTIYKKIFYRPNSFILWLFIQKHALKASFLVFVFTVHAFYNAYVG